MLGLTASQEMHISSTHSVDMVPEFAVETLRLQAMDMFVPNDDSIMSPTHSALRGAYFPGPTTVVIDGRSRSAGLNRRFFRYAPSNRSWRTPERLQWRG